MNKTLRNLALVALVAAPFSAFAEITGTGTETDPYIIATTEDLCSAYLKVVGAGPFYFEQTDDIDMAGVTDYHAFAGYNGAYTATIHYDGKNHLIKNFAPADFPGNTAAIPEGNLKYYCTSVFGVAVGSISNLGVTGVNIEGKDAGHGMGILCAYGGYTYGELEIDNVFVEGTVKGSKYYTGGMVGTTNNTVTITNSFANVKVENDATLTAGLIGRVRNDVTMSNVYVAGSVSKDGFLVAASDKATYTLDATDVIAFNIENGNASLSTGTGLISLKPGSTLTVATPETKLSLIEDVQNWAAFSDTKIYKGYPILKDFEEMEGTTGIFEAAVEEANGPAVYYNLQGVQVANPDNGIYIVRRGNKVTKELIRK